MCDCQLFQVYVSGYKLYQRTFLQPTSIYTWLLFFCVSTCQDHRLLNRTDNHQTQQQFIVQGRHTDSRPSLIFTGTVFYWVYSQCKDTGRESQKVSILLVVSWELNEVQQPAVTASFSLMQEFIPIHSQLWVMFYYTSYPVWLKDTGGWPAHSPMFFLIRFSLLCGAWQISTWVKWKVVWPSISLEQHDVSWPGK